MRYAYMYCAKQTVQKYNERAVLVLRKKNDYSFYNHVIIHSMKQLIARHDSLHHLLLILNISGSLASACKSETKTLTYIA